TAYTWDAATGQPQARLHLPAAGRWLWLEGGVLSPDGSTAVTFGHNRETDKTEEIVFWATADGEEQKPSIKCEALTRLEFNGCRFSRDGKRFVVARDGGVDVYDIGRREKLVTLTPPPPGVGNNGVMGTYRPRILTIDSVFLTPDGGVVVVDCGYGVLLVWEAATGRVRNVTVPFAKSDANYSVSHLFSDGKTLAVVVNKVSLMLLDLATGETRRLDLPGRILTKSFTMDDVLIYSPDEKTLAVYDRSGVALIDLATRKSRRF